MACSAHVVASGEMSEMPCLEASLVHPGRGRVAGGTQPNTRQSNNPAEPRGAPSRPPYCPAPAHRAESIPAHSVRARTRPEGSRARARRTATANGNRLARPSRQPAAPTPRHAPAAFEKGDARADRAGGSGPGAALSVSGWQRVIKST
jgi:hypothetical protein